VETAAISDGDQASQWCDIEDVSHDCRF
jgi:hypothetical protein